MNVGSRVLRASGAAAAALLLLASAGCGNPCQQLCSRMARAWVDCDMSVPDNAVSECKAALGDPTDDERTVCVAALGNGEGSLSARWDDCCDIRYPLPGMAIPDGDDCVE